MVVKSINNESNNVYFSTVHKNRGGLSIPSDFLVGIGRNVTCIMHAHIPSPYFSANFLQRITKYKYFVRCIETRDYL